jgi:hypothetical protein
MGLLKPMIDNRNDSMCAIIELKMEMGVKKIEHSTLKLFCNRVIESLPSHGLKSRDQELSIVLDMMLKKMSLREFYDAQSHSG